MKNTAKNKTHYESFKRQLTKKFDAIQQLIKTAVPYDDVDADEESNTKDACFAELENLKESIIESMGEILGD